VSVYHSSKICISYIYHTRIYGCLTSTYESGFTRLFLYGRTDTIRASSTESLAFCRAMQDPSVAVRLYGKLHNLLL